jgi:hypothetical protein
MGLKQILTGWIVGLVVERPAHGLALAEMAARMQAEGQRIEAHCAAAADSAFNRKLVRHMVGIERWGQRRLRVALGEPPVTDEYDAYRPSPDLSWRAVQAEFRATRQHTVELARQIEQAGADARAARVPHNAFGPLSVRGWLRYLSLHARGESIKLRAG